MTWDSSLTSRMRVSPPRLTFFGSAAPPSSSLTQEPMSCASIRATCRRTCSLSFVRMAASSWFPSISFLARHLGIRHVGLGSDYDGIPKGVRGLHTGVDAYPVLVDALLERFSPSDVALVIGGNFLRVWDNVLRQASTAV